MISENHTKALNPFREPWRWYHAHGLRSKIIKPCTSELEETVMDADARVLVVKNKEYLNLDLERIRKKMRTPVIVDCRNAYDKAECERIGFTYKGVGKPRNKPLEKV